MRDNPIGREATIALILIVTLSFVAGFAARGNLKNQILLPINPVTQSYCVDNGWHGLLYYDGIRGGGNFPDVGGGSGEIFNSDKFYISWAAGGASEYITVQGAARGCDQGFGHWSNGFIPARYAFSINVGNGFQTFRTNDVPNGIIEVDEPNHFYTQNYVNSWYYARSGNFQIKGVQFKDDAGNYQPIVDGSVLKVDFQVKADAGGAWVTISSDQARLLSAVPRLNWGAAIYQIGQTAQVYWTVPIVTSGSSTAYYLTITDQNTGNTIGVYSLWPITKTSGSVTIPVTSSLFVPSGQNRIRATIYSQVFLAGVTDTATIDDIAKAPSITKVAYSPAQPRLGDTVTVTITATTNGATALPIVRYHVTAFIGGNIIYDKDSNASTISFPVSASGSLLIEATAYDSYGRPSAVYNLNVQVGNVIDVCAIAPDLPECGGGGGPTDSGWQLLLFLLVLGFVLFAIGAYAPIPSLVARGILVTVGVVMIALSVYGLAYYVVAWFKSAFPVVP